MNSRTFKDLWNKILGLSSTCPVFKYFQGLEFRSKKFKYFQVLSKTFKDVRKPGNNNAQNNQKIHENLSQRQSYYEVTYKSNYWPTVGRLLDKTEAKNKKHR